MIHEVLEGRLVRLEPLSAGHVPALAEAAAEDRSAYQWAPVPGSPAATASYVDDLLAGAAAGEVVPFASVRVADGRPVGATRFMTLCRWPGREALYSVEIGGTWLAASAQRTGINVEAKLLMLAFAFERWDVGRVSIKTDVRNERSRAAIAALGATFEGVLRSWQPSNAAGEDGRLRDTAMFSIVAAEWPAVADRLRRRLGRSPLSPE